MVAAKSLDVVARMPGMTGSAECVSAYTQVKNVELEKHLQKYKGRLVLRGTTSVIRMASSSIRRTRGRSFPNGGC